MSAADTDRPYWTRTETAMTLAILALAGFIAALLPDLVTDLTASDVVTGLLLFVGTFAALNLAIPRRWFQ